jgi:hypothetical protein
MKKRLGGLVVLAVLLSGRASGGFLTDASLTDTEISARSKKSKKE